VAQRTDILRRMCDAAGADTLIVDSIKDAAIGLSGDEVGAGYNRARQAVIAEGVEMLELHHQRKAGSDNAKPNSISDVYGSTWITSGAGSVVLLWGDPGDSVVELSQLKPVAETLAKFQEHVAALEKTRSEETGGLKEQLAQLMTASSATRDEARKLTEALRGNTGRRGRWGEQTCRNVLEAAGMAGRFDFTEQTSSADDEGRQNRPDFIVRLPGGGMFVIDAKVPLAAYLDAIEARDEDTRKAHLQSHVRQMRDHIKKLSAKGYWQYEDAPEFVVMFVDEAMYRVKRRGGDGVEWDDPNVAALAA
jgi:hypothetical protein